MSPRLGDLFLTAQSDERLVSLAQAGHERAFAVIVERYRSELLVLARRLSSDGKGEDIVQQAFLSAFTALRSGAEVRHLRGWLYQIVRNAANRSHAPVCVPLDGATAGGETVEDIVQQRATAIGALTEMARLPSRQRQAIVGTALDGRPRAEIASAMGLSEGAVRQLVHRARAQLRTVVTAVTPWPVARWFAGARPGSGSTAEMVAGAGAGVASSSGVALKLGALLASGTIATGAAVVDIHGSASRPHRATARAAVSHAEHSRGSRAGVAASAGRSGPTAELAAATVAAVSTVRGELSPRHRGAGDDAGASLERHGRGEGSVSTPSGHGGGGGGQSGGSGQQGGGGSSGNGGGSPRGGGTGGPGPSSGSGASSGGDGGSPMQTDGGAQAQTAPQPVAVAATDDTVSDRGGSSDPDGHGGSGGGSGSGGGGSSSGGGGSGGASGSSGRDGGSRLRLRLRPLTSSGAGGGRESHRISRFLGQAPKKNSVTF